MLFELNIEFKYRMILVFLLAFAATWLIFWPILRIALDKNLVDNPDARKLQKIPIPVLGGAAVFFGIIIGLTFFKTMHHFSTLFPVISAMVIMLYFGIIDDIRGLSPKLRFCLEILVALLLIYGNRTYICNLQGLFGVDMMPAWLGILLTVLTFVGIVNAINMIDGVDGLSSSLCMLSSACFFVLFFLAHDFSYAALAAVSMGAMLPFFLHNVFGWSSKMFLGDGGTMVMGTLISTMVIEILDQRFGAHLIAVTGYTLGGHDIDINLVAFCLAAVAMPVSDTLRVMTERICAGYSPFKADNRHLHHLFVRNGYSYIGTTMREFALGLAVVACCVVAWALGTSANVQLLVVVVSAAMANLIPAALLRNALNKPESKYAKAVQAKGEKSHVERKGIWLKIQKIIDRS